VLLSAIIWTVVSTREYPPEFYENEEQGEEMKTKFRIPKTMWQLLLVQFFSWFALFSMWVFTTPAVAKQFYNTVDPNSTEFQNAGDWVGILFGIYNGVSAIIALSLPKIAKRIGRRATHAFALGIGGLSFLSFAIIPNADLLVIPMIGIGIAWGSILAMPYAMLANSIPPKQMGMFMGLFNMSITIPQIVNGIFGGLILQYVFNDDPIKSLYMAGVFMILGAGATFLVQDKLDIKRTQK
ncbi:MAG: SLC45 family MFS transporter, partial [Chlorobi bacterium]|nr:SLC45 family MFS transporter [Chlorobiota bacterium]